MKDTVFLLPAYNEEKSIGEVISEIKEQYPHAGIITVDNNSSDNTPRIAKEFGATVLSETCQGKGYAIRKGFRHILDNTDAKYVIMLDSDHTYDPRDAESLRLALIKEGYDIILGSRLKGKIASGGLPGIRMLGNRSFTFLMGSFYGVKVSDICTGYWVFTREGMAKLLEYPLTAKGFELEAEMVIKAAKLGLRVGENPINYRNRLAGESRLNTFSDGLKILRIIFLYRVFDDSGTRHK